MNVPYWRSDPDYYGKSDPRRPQHLAELFAQERINQRIVAASSFGDGSYSVTVTPREKA